MFILFAVVLGVVWLLGFAVYHITSGGFHLLLLLAFAAVIVHFFRSARQHRVT